MKKSIRLTESELITLIKRVITEQEEEEYIPIPKWNYEKKYKDVYNYLDNKGLVKRKSKYSKGIILAYPDEEYGILGWQKNDILHIYYELIDEISSTFGFNEFDSKSIIGRWVSDRYQLEVRNTKETWLLP